MKSNRATVALGPALSGLALFLGGCQEVVLLHPKGPVGEAERSLILIAFGLMMIVVVPVFLMAFWFPWKYRASNRRATYMPTWSYSGKLDVVLWVVPLAIVAVLATLTWWETFRLDPYKPLDPAVEPFRVEAVSLDWKWLFIYPDRNLATVNQLVFPARVPLSLRLTSDTVMTSFFIPQLGSQIYAMGGMQTQLNLMADEPGTYAGQNQQYSGRGYSGMQFQALAATPEQFDAWERTARSSPRQLDLARYEELAKPSVDVPVMYFSSVHPGLFNHIMAQYASPEMMRHMQRMQRDESGGHGGHGGHGGGGPKEGS